MNEATQNAWLKARVEQLETELELCGDRAMHGEGLAKTRGEEVAFLRGRIAELEDQLELEADRGDGLERHDDDLIRVLFSSAGLDPAQVGSRGERITVLRAQLERVKQFRESGDRAREKVTRARRELSRLLEIKASLSLDDLLAELDSRVAADQKLLAERQSAILGISSALHDAGRAAGIVDASRYPAPQLAEKIRAEFRLLRSSETESQRARHEAERAVGQLTKQIAELESGLEHDDSTVATLRRRLRDEQRAAKEVRRQRDESTAQAIQVQAELADTRELVLDALGFIDPTRRYHDRGDVLGRSLGDLAEDLRDRVKDTHGPDGWLTIALEKRAELAGRIGKITGTPEPEGVVFEDLVEELVGRWTGVPLSLTEPERADVKRHLEKAHGVRVDGSLEDTLLFIVRAREAADSASLIARAPRR